MARNKTFLLDKKNRILVVGEPFGNKEKWDVYKKAKNIDLYGYIFALRCLLEKP